MESNGKLRDQFMDKSAKPHQQIIRSHSPDVPRKQAKNDPLTPGELLESLLSTPHFLIAYMDTDFDFIRVNPAYAEAHGHEPEFFVGKNHFDLNPDEENEAMFRRVLETGEPYAATANPYLAHSKSEARRWDWALHPAKDGSGVVMGLVLYLVNVTERVRQERLLREYHSLLEQLVYERTTELLEANEQLQRRIREHEHVEEALRGYRDHLEELVNARTAELTKVNERLRQEIEERERLILELQDALAKVKTLRGLLSICPSCKKVCDDEGHWHQIDEYIREHSEAGFAHSLCPECATNSI